MKKTILFLSFILSTCGVYAQPITGAASVCAGSVTTLSNGSPGGIWVSGSMGIATVDSFSGDVTGVTVGTSVITYYFLGGGSVTDTITVIALPAVITGVAIVCEGASTAFADTTTGGTWSSSNVAVAFIGSTGVATGISGDTATIYYTSLATGCASIVTITVNPSPFPITGFTQYCVGITDSLYEWGGGTWSTASPAIIGLGAAGDITGVAAGSATITYTLPTGCTAFLPVTVSPLPIAGTAVSADVVCVTHNINATSDACCGIWSSSDVSVAVVGSGSGIVTGISPGLVTIKYAVTNSCGTANAYTAVNVLSLADCDNVSVKNITGSKTLLTAYPNPARNGTFTLNLLSGSNEPADIVIRNVMGATVKSFNSATNQKNSIVLEQPAGLYFITATTAHGRYQSKITLQ